MQEISPIFWMSIIGVVTLLLLFVLYELGMLLMESRESIKKANGMFDDFADVVSRARNLVEVGEDVLGKVMSPFKYLGALVTFVEELLTSKSDSVEKSSLKSGALDNKDDSGLEKAKDKG